ncbi:MAG: alpha/beta hydrolase [Henriciella sp.]
MLRWILGILVVVAAGAVAAWWWLNRPLIVRHPNFGTDCSTLVSDADLGSKVDCIQVWYGTDRKLTTDDTQLASDTVDVNEALGESGEQLRLGRADVWLPKLVEEGGNRNLGETPHVQGAAPRDQNKLAEYVFLTRITMTGRETFTSTLQDAIYDDRASSVLLFVHGFNVQFDEALVRTAQLSNDLSREERYQVGVPVLYSWPSAGALSLEDYRGDRERSLGAAPYLEEFLDLLTEDLDVDRVNIIAHSMGNRVLTQALEDYAKDYLDRHNRNDLEFRIMLVAADVERDIFDAANTAFDSLDANVTIYTSDTDRALHISSFVNEEGRKRLGDTDKNRPYIRSSQNYQTIDATSVATELFGIGHNYYSDNPTILWDMMCTIGETAPQERALEVARFGDLPDGEQYYRINSDLKPGDEACKLRREAYPVGQAPITSAEETPSPQSAPPKAESVSPANEASPAPTTRSLPAPPPPPPPPPEAMVNTQIAPALNRIYVEDYDSLDLSPYLSSLEQALEGVSEIETIRIRAYSDTVGSDAVNLERTERFAQAIKDWFVSRGVNADLITAEGFGETRLSIDTEDEVSQLLNRVVEIEILEAG